MPPLDRVCPFSASCAADRSEVALHGLAVGMPRCRDSMIISGPIASSGDERQVEQYSARLLGRLRPDGGVRVGSAQPLGKTQGRPACSAKRNAWRGGLASSTITNDVGGSPGLRSRCSPLGSLLDRPTRRRVQHAPRPIASVVHGRPPVAVPLAAQATGSIVRSLKARVARIRTADLAAV